MLGSLHRINKINFEKLALLTINDFDAFESFAKYDMLTINLDKIVKTTSPFGLPLSIYSQIFSGLNTYPCHIHSQ
jgi:hypothetical protein